MNRSTLFATLALSAILGAGIAQAQAKPDSTAAPAPPVTAQPAPPATPAPPAPAPAQPPAVYYEKAIVVIDGEAEANGSLGLVFTPLGGVGKTVTVNVMAKAKKKDVARDIHKELSIAAGSAYKVKLENDKVSLSKADKKKSPNFALSMTKLDVGGMSVRVAKD